MLTLVRTTTLDPDMSAAACAVRADGRIGDAMDRIGDAIAALHERRMPASEAERKAISAMREAWLHLSFARNVLAPDMVERGA